MNRFDRALRLAIFAILPSLVFADQGSFSNSGGSGVASAGISITSSPTTPAGTLNLNCPQSSVGTCSGGSLTYLSNDGLTSINGIFISGTFAESCSGGGKGGHVSCGYTFTGYFSGTLTVNSATQAITGQTYQTFGTGGAAALGTGIYNSAYAPFYYSDSEQILRSDDLLGTNQISYGVQGGGVGQFYGALGIALDAAGRIYVADTYNCRIVRIDDMLGTNWTSYGGTCGSGDGQFYDPSGIALDSTGRIYVMDTGNSRVVRIDDLNGTNWITYGSVGSGVGQFAQWLTSVAVDSSGRIYVADTGNKRIVRIDDVSGTNWTALTQSVPVNGASYSFQSPVAVAVDSAGKIYVADNEYYAPALIRIDDMTGVNWTSIYVSPTGSGGPNSIAVDAGGTVFAGGGGVKFIDNMAGVLNSSGSVIAPYGSYYVFGITPIPLPSPRPSAISFTPAALSFTQNVGTNSSQIVTIANFGGSPLNFGSISASSGFAATPNCPAMLPAGSNCTVSVTFAPAVTGTTNGSLTIADDSGNAGATQTVTLTALATAPVASLTPASVAFGSQLEGTTSASKTVTLKNTGDGPMQVSSMIATASFNQSNTCGTSIQPGSQCTIQVSFAPTAVGPASGSLTISDNAGTQTVTLTGTGSAPVTLSSTSLNFSVVAIGDTSAAKNITLTNHGKVSLNFGGIVTSAGFAVAINTCGSSVAAGSSCKVGVTFSPTATGAITGTLTFTDDALNSPQTVALTGTGSVPVTVSAASLNLGTVTVGKISSAKSITLTNHENTAVSLSSVAASAGFNITSNSCGASVAAGANCSVHVTFSPSAPGPATGTLTFTDDAANGPQVVSLMGTGK
ncbi:MAG TPA: choice-of-anchor D domain-containing protein [Bryobacteraceae bacterium]|nr:choice-of-anchor D domain-containing protein [Bryobacteraceae bacterium]